MRKVLRTFLVLLLSIGLILPATSLAAFAADSGDYSYTESGGNATITHYKGSDSTVIIPDMLDGYTVTEIGEGAFAGNSDITSVTIPEHVTSIADDAFSDCYLLKEITVDPSNSAFSSENGILFNHSKTELVRFTCDNPITNYTVPDGVTKINPRAFEGSSNLTHITIPGSVIDIGDYAFGYCQYLQAIDVDPLNATYLSDDNGVLFNKTKTRLMRYPVGSFNAIYSIPFGVTTIDNDAFINSHIKIVNIPESVETIGDFAFQNCDKLSDIKIPDSVISIGIGAFSSIGTLTQITVDSSNTLYSSDENGVLFNKDKTQLLQYPSGRTDAAYTIPATVSKIIAPAFVGSQLKRIDLANVQTIEDFAFSESALTEITIPDTVSELFFGVFSSCADLRRAVFEGDAPELTGDVVFENNAEGFKILYPSGKTGYLSPNWLGAPSEAYEGTVPPLQMQIKCDILSATTAGGGSDGSITVTVIAGDSDSGSYEYSINGTDWQSSNVFSDLADATYTVSARDAEDDSNTASKEVAVDRVGIRWDAQVTNATTYGGTNGSITVLTSATDKDVYEYSINNTDWQTSNIFSNLKSGEYTVWHRIAADQSDGGGFGGVIVDEPAPTPVGLSCTKTDATTGESNGSITVTASGGNSGSYEYSINGTTWQTSNKFSSFSAGVYTVRVRDAETVGNVAYKHITVGEKDEFSYTESGGKAKITAYTGSGGAVTIPAELGGYPVTEIDASAFSGNSTITSVTIPSSITTIGSHAFSDCDALEAVTMPSNLATLGDYAFSDCDALESVTIPASLTTIGECAFESCDNLSSVTLSNGLSFIGESMFTECKVLDNITIPSSVTTIKTFAFRYCDGLKSITIPSTVTTIESGAFYDCASLSSVTLNEGLASIGDYMFYYCDALESVTIPSSVNTIGESAFEECHKLGSVTINDGVKSIGPNAFLVCEALTSITIPASVNTIGDRAFDSSNAFKKAIIYGKTVSFGTDVFKYTKINEDGLYGYSVSTVHDYATSNSIPFHALQGVVSVSANNAAYGSVSGGGSYDLDGTANVSATPTAGYHFVRWTESGSSVSTNANYSFIVTGDRTLVAVFEKDETPAPAVIPVSLSCSKTDVTSYGGANGSITASAAGGNSGSYQYSINSGNWQNANTFGGLAAGTYTVAVRDAGNNSNSASAIVTISQPAQVPVSLSCTKTDATTYGGTNGSITVTASGGNSGSYEYSVNNGNWQSTNAFGGLKADTYTVAVRDAGFKDNTAKCSVSIDQPAYVGKVPANKVPQKAAVDTAITVTPPAAPKGYTTQTVTYASSNPSVATVDANGNVTFLAGGKVTITTTIVSTTVDKNGKVKTKTTTVKKTITVNQLVETISLNTANATIAKTQKVTLAANIAPGTASNKQVTWKSSNPKVASVSGSGVVTGKTGGTAIITCTAKDGSGASASCTVTVTPMYPTGLKMSKAALTIKTGKTAALRATIAPAKTDFKTVTWVSSNPAVAIVDSKGKVKAIAPGSAVITATTSNGISAACTVTVQ